MGQSGSSSGCVIMMDYLPVLLVATLVGSGLADPDPTLAAVNKAFTSFVHPSSSRPQPSYNAPPTSYKPASAYSNPAPAYGAPPEDKCYIKPSFSKEPSGLLLEVQQLLNITFTPDPCLDGPFNGNGTWEEEPYGSHGHHERIKRQIRGNGRRGAQTGRNMVRAQGSLPGINLGGDGSGLRQLGR